MPLYEYHCLACGDVYVPFMHPDSDVKKKMDSGTVQCHVPGCWGLYRRRFSFSTPADPIGDGYYDNSAGAFITSKRQLDDVNKARSAEMSERLGLEHRFVAREVGDVKPPEVG